MINPMRIEDEHCDELEVASLEDDTLLELSVFHVSPDSAPESYVGGVVLNREGVRKLYTKLAGWLGGVDEGEPALTSTEVLS